MKEGKMSKSVGNIVYPMDVVNEYGLDALRYYLTTSSAPGMDLRFDEDKVKSTWNFINKLWNASRFVLLNLDGMKEVTLKDLRDEDKWILTKYEEVLKSTIKHMDKYEFNLVGTELYSFIWDDFCSSYIEFAKFNLDNNTTKSVLYTVLTGIIKMLHPFMPFVTEEIYQMLPIKDADSIMISEYPKYDKTMNYEEEYLKVNDKLEFIRKYRNILKENNIYGDYQVKLNFEDTLTIKMLKLQDRLVAGSKKTPFDVKHKELEAIIYYDKVITEEEKELKEKQINDLKASISKRENLLNNEGFVSKAPANLVENEKKKLKEEKELLESLIK